MRVFVTGSEGFLGRHLVSALVEHGHLVIGLLRDYFPERRSLGKHEASALVLGSLDQVERGIAEYECDTVIHLAAQTQVSTAAAHPEGTLEANVRGTWQVLEACRRQKVRRVVVASSDKAYGLGAVPYQEAQGVQPHGIYATSKACADLIATAYGLEYGMSIAITRCGNLYGPGHLNWTALIPGAIKSVLAGERPKLRSDGGPKRDYLHVSDAVRGYVRLALGDEVGPFNFGTGQGTSAIEVARLVAQVAGLPYLEPLVAVEGGPGAGGQEIPEQVLACGRAARELEWVPLYNLGSGLNATIPWYREFLTGDTQG